MSVHVCHQEESSESLAPEVVVERLGAQVRSLPPPVVRTLAHLLRHLSRVVENAAENQMSASNLGIVFGPTLLRSRSVPRNHVTRCTCDLS